jgi:hypothetical protein
MKNLRVRKKRIEFRYSLNRPLVRARVEVHQRAENARREGVHLDLHLRPATTQRKDNENENLLFIVRNTFSGET